MKTKQRFAFTPGRLAAHLFIGLLSLASIFPVAWMAYSSLKTKAEFAKSVLALPRSPQFGNYVRAFQIGEMEIYFLNSVIVSAVSVSIIVLSAFLAAYALARYSFKLRAALYAAFISGMLIPVHGLLIPIFILFSRTGLLDHRVTLVLPYVAFGLPIAIFVLESFIRGIPREMEEAAHMDGAGLPALLFRVILPMCGPALSTAFILSFLSAWNEFPFALVLIKTKALKTLPIGLTNFSGQYLTDYPKLMAALMIALLPVIAVYLVAHRAIMRGMGAGAVKG
jgi:raffinose/stachyose/melibiose transport system permease protein